MQFNSSERLFSLQQVATEIDVCGSRSATIIVIILVVMHLKQLIMLYHSIYGPSRNIQDSTCIAGQDILSHH